MTRYRIQSLTNIAVGLLIVIQARFQPSPYATKFSSKMFFVGGIILVISGVALFFAPESRPRRETTPS